MEFFKNFPVSFLIYKKKNHKRFKNHVKKIILPKETVTLNILIRTALFSSPQPSFPTRHFVPVNEELLWKNLWCSDGCLERQMPPEGSWLKEWKKDWTGRGQELRWSSFPWLHYWYRRLFAHLPVIGCSERMGLWGYTHSQRELVETYWQRARGMGRRANCHWVSLLEINIPKILPSLTSNSLEYSHPRHIHCSWLCTSLWALYWRKKKPYPPDPP